MAALTAVDVESGHSVAGQGYWSAAYDGWQRLKLSRAQFDCEQSAPCILESKDCLSCLAILSYRHNTLYLDQAALYIPILRLQV